MNADTYETRVQREQAILTRLEDLALRQRRTGQVMSIEEARGLVAMVQAAVQAQAAPDSILEL